MTNLRKHTIAVAAFCLLSLFSCGYHFSQEGGILPQGVKTIAIPVFVNSTFEPYVDVDVTKAVVEEFLTDGRLKVVSTDDADVVMRGKVTKFELIPQTYSVDPYVTSYNVVISVTIVLIDGKTQQVLMQDTTIGTVFNSSYAVTLGDISATKKAKSAAITSASKDLASSIRSRILEGF
jgi:curli biogenesis system outer membrane secretion channel CsgG